MRISFGFLNFELVDDKIRLLSLNGDSAEEGYFSFAEVSIVGENKTANHGSRIVPSSESPKLRYISHAFDSERLTIVQASELVRVETVFERYEDTSAVRVYATVTNISGQELVLEDVAIFCVPQAVHKDASERSDLYFYKFLQSHQMECQVLRQSFYENGIFRGTSVSQKSIAYGNIGSWSTKEQLPQGIIEDAKNGCFLMFQIESSQFWKYEISDVRRNFYICLSGASFGVGGWYKSLAHGESYTTATAAIACSDTLNGVIGEMSRYRRHIKGVSEIDEGLSTIFNEYMHLSWDSPSEQNTAKIAPIVAKTGVDYYVIDCGWHNEEPGNIIYPFVGQWKESKTRFPSGVRKTTDFIRSLGMKAGLWIEPEIIGVDCKEMLAYYDDDCFLTRHGRKICRQGRYFLDFTNKKVVDYLNETVRRMVEDYGADYIKLDYNQDVGVGTDKYGTSFAEGVEIAAKAYLAWIDGVRARFKNVLFETCSSGGMRMDYQTLSHFSIISTSDQTQYLSYPYIAGNALAAVLPEQAAVWSYPVDSRGGVNGVFEPTREWCEENISCEQVILNMINSFLGRMHLASHLEVLSEEKFALVKEGVAYYKSIVQAKKTAAPYLPNGFTKFGDKLVASGFETKDKIYLAVWNLGESGRAEIKLNRLIKSAKIAYPVCAETSYSAECDKLIIDFENAKSARFFEIEK